MGQTPKYSLGADVFRSAPNNGHGVTIAASPINRSSNTLPESPVSLALGDVVPRVIIQLLQVRVGESANSGLDRAFVRVLLFCDDVHALEALRVDGSLHHAGLFCFVDD